MVESVLTILPRKLRWNLKIPPWKRRNIYMNTNHQFLGSMLNFRGVATRFWVHSLSAPSSKKNGWRITWMTPWTPGRGDSEIGNLRFSGSMLVFLLHNWWQRSVPSVTLWFLRVVHIWFTALLRKSQELWVVSVYLGRKPVGKVDDRWGVPNGLSLWKIWRCNT